MADGFRRRGPGKTLPELILSVVVIGRNEGQRLIRCLDSVRSMNFPREAVELIYVDSDSNDGSVEAATGFGAQVVSIKTGRMCAARARNSGWQISSAPFVLFLDGDTVLHPEFVARALPEFDNSQVMVVWGHRREIHPNDSLYNRVLDLDWIFPLGFTEFCGGDAIMRRSILESTGGFDQGLIAGEEPDLCRRIRGLGGLILHIDAPMTGHDLAMSSWSQYWRRAVRTGYAYAEVGAIYKGTSDPLWSQASKRNVFSVVCLCVALGLAVYTSVALRSVLPSLLLVAAAALLVFRTALRNRHRNAPALTLLLFAIHSHVQQIPIFLGQVRRWLDTTRDSRSEIIEYKDGRL